MFLLPGSSVTQGWTQSLNYVTFDLFSENKYMIQVWRIYGEKGAAPSGWEDCAEKEDAGESKDEFEIWVDMAHCTHQKQMGQ